MKPAPEKDQKTRNSLPCLNRHLVAGIIVPLLIISVPSIQVFAQQTDGLLRQSLDSGDELDDLLVQGVNDGLTRGDRNSRNTTERNAVFGDTIDLAPDDGAGDTGRSANAPDQASANRLLTTGSVSNTNTRVDRSRRQDPVGSPGDDGQFEARGNTRATTVEGGAVNSEVDPFAALGIRLGVFDLFPTLEQSVGYSTNAEAAQNGNRSGFSETNLGVRLQSNWLRHSFQAELGATYQRFFSSDADALPRANANSTLRLDVGQEYALTLRGGYNFSTENVTSTNLATGGAATIDARPAVEAFSSSAEFEKVRGKLRFSLRGSLTKSAYENASLSDGSVLSQTDRNNLLAEATGRVSFEASPAVTPFVEGSVGRRIYDLKVDSNGNRRDSRIYALRGGMELDFGEKLSGRLAVGYTAEEFEDANINTLGALTFDGSLVWSPMRLTTVTATASTTLSPSANINDNGSVVYAGTLGISRQVRPQLTLDANLTGRVEDFDTTGRRDVTIGVNVGYTYWFNRFVAATGRVSYENIDSSAAGSSYDVGAIRFGLRFQR